MTGENTERKYLRRQFLGAAGGFGLSLLCRRVASGQTGAAAQDVKPGTYDWSLEHRGLTRTFRIHLPPAYTPSKPAPLVLALHGGGGRGQGMERLSEFNPVADKHGFIVVYPDALDRLWKDGVIRNNVDKRDIDDVGFFAALIDELARRCAIERSRVYATGISNGGHMSNRLATELSDRFAAIGPVGATLDTPYAASHAPKRPVSVIYFHGTADPLRYFNGGGQPGGQTLSARAMTDWWVEKNGCVKKPKVETLPDPVEDGTKVKRESYGGGREGTEVVLYIIEGGGHTWPGGWQYYPEERIGKTCRDINASELMWEFFAKHRRAAR